MPEGSRRWPVLVVDDDKSVRTLFATVLRQVGLDAVEAANGREALEIVASRRVSAVLLDSQMPEVDGVEVLRRLRDRSGSHTLPVIFVTGEGDVDQRVRALEAGADDYLTKPVHVQELIARVRAQLRGQAAWLRVLEDRMRERTDVVKALARQRRGGTPEDTADMICGHLSELPQLAFVSVVAFAADGSAVPLAMRGESSPHVRVSRPLPPPLATRLRARALTGPWQERAEDATEGGTTPALHELSASSETAFAPLMFRDQLLGVLAVAGGDAPGQVSGRSLALAIDVAAVAATLLGSALEHAPRDETLRAGIERIVGLRAFRTVYQPIVFLDDLSVTGYEALTRFHDGASPETRFTEATQVGLGVSLELAAIESALEAGEPLPADCTLSLNVSAAALLEHNRMGTLLAGTDRAVVLELTEHDRIDDYPSVLNAVAALGPDIRLSVDDAGAGYACLTHVLALRPQYVKMDRGWVRGIESDPARQALVAGLRHFTRNTGSRLVAEGIETEAELAILRDLEVEMGQGFLLGEPRPVSVG